ncbi:MAG: phosphate acetyltransferase [Candidatus Gracilibacteria bacterium]
MLQNFIKVVKKHAKENPARIVFPETNDPRVVDAIKKIREEKTANPITFDIKKESKRIGEFGEIFFEMRKDKGLTKEEAVKLMQNPNYFATMLVHIGEADGMISGSLSTTADVLHPALQVIRTKEKFRKISGFFFMILENRLLLFADCAVNIEPNSHELADLAIDTAETARRFGIEPRIAMLSFSTNGSAKHPNVARVKEATQMVNHLRPDLICEGEMQVDAALVPEVCAQKFPKSRVPGNANVLIFPNLEAANIAYKLVERFGKAHAIGPILQGLQKPINDLSRGCTVEDIVTLAAFTSVEAAEKAIDTKEILFNK